MLSRGGPIRSSDEGFVMKPEPRDGLVILAICQLAKG